MVLVNLKEKLNNVRPVLTESYLGPALCPSAAVLVCVPLLTGHRASSGSHWLLLLSIKSCEDGAGWSHAVRFYGHTQLGSGASPHVCPHSKRLCYGGTQRVGAESASRKPQKEVWGRSEQGSITCLLF